MRVRLIVITAIATALLSLSANGQSVKPVYKIDSASAKIVNRHLVISATGAVRSGGWNNPRLHVKEVYVPEASTLVVEFLATPPAAKDVVVQALLPVTASVTAHLPQYGMIEVKVVGETNSVTVPIIR